MTWHYHTASGLAIRSVLALPALPEGGDGADVCMRWQHLPDTLPTPVHTEHDHQARPGEALIRRQSGHFLVREGSDVAIHPDPHRAHAEVAQALAGIVMGVLLHQRGQLPLHASAVAHGKNGILLLGRRGAGKSTLAAHLHQRGYRVLCDDYCALDLSEEGPIRLMQGTRYLKLEREAVEGLGLAVQALIRLPTKKTKYRYPIDDDTTGNSPARLRAIVLLASGDRDVIEPVGSVHALHLLWRFIYRRGYLKGLGLIDAHFRLCSQVAATVPVWQLKRSSAAVEPIITQLEALLHSD